MQSPHINYGAKFYIADALPATLDAAGFAALNYVQVKGVRLTGAWGVKKEVKLISPLDGVASNEVVGTEAANQRVEVIDFDDVGQTMLKNTIADTNHYAYKFVSGTGKVKYFTAQTSERFGNEGDRGVIHDFYVVLEFKSRLIEL